MSTNIDDLAWLVHYARILLCFNYEISQNFRKGQSRNASYLARISTCKHLVTLVLDLSFVRKRSEPHTYSPLLGRATLVAIRFLSQAYGSSGCLPAPPSRQSFWVGPRRSRWPLGSPSINTSPTSHGHHSTCFTKGIFEAKHLCCHDVAQGSRCCAVCGVPERGG